MPRRMSGFLPRRVFHTPHTHGTGCSLASAIATFLAQKYGLEEAVALARNYVHVAIAEAPGFGHGHGPLNHAAGLVQNRHI